MPLLLQMSKAPIQAVADRLSAVFVPIVLLMALATWLGWFLAGVTHAYPEGGQACLPWLLACLPCLPVCLLMESARCVERQ